MHILVPLLHRINQPYLQHLPWGSCSLLFSFALLHRSALSCTALENVLPAHIDDRNNLLLDSWNHDQNVRFYHIGNKFSHAWCCWYLVTDFCHGHSVLSMRFTLTEISPFSSMVIAQAVCQLSCSSWLFQAL